MRRSSWPVMGSYASLAIADEAPDPQAAVAAARAWLESVEAALSPYRPDSDLCRWRSGASDLADCSPLLREVIDQVRDLPALTDGGFHPYDREGRYDPTGYVKGWAVQRAVAILARSGVRDACLGVGGDIQTIGRAGAGRPWRVAVTDPAHEGRILALVAAPEDGSRFAVATSGDAQRGDHIWAGSRLTAGLSRSRAGAGLSSVTVVGPDLCLADAFATAIWAHARTRELDEAWAWLEGTGYEALAVGRTGRIRTTSAMSAHLAQPAA